MHRVSVNPIAPIPYKGRKMLTYDISKAGKLKLYEYICRKIKEDIKAGNLKQGEKMPSKREFAKNLGVSVVTVETAYDQLLSEGILVSVPRRGFFVDADAVSLGSGVKADHSRVQGKTRVSTAQGDAPALGTAPLLADFRGQGTEATLFPLTAWNSMVREVLNDSRVSIMANPPCEGAYALRACIAGYLREFRDMNVKPEQVFIGAGTEYLFGLLVQLLGIDRLYAVEDPGYRKAEQICCSMKARCVRIPLDESGIMPEELERSKAQIVHVTPSHQYPTGIVMPKERRAKLLAWASAGKDRIIIEDDYDSELRLSGAALAPLFSEDTTQSVIYMNTFTRTLCHTARISYMVLPERLAALFKERLSFYSCTVSSFEQYTLAAFIRSGKFESLQNRLKNHYRKKKELLTKALTTGKMAGKATVSGDEAGLHFLLKLNTGLPETTVTDRAAAAGIRLIPLSGWGLTSKDTENTYVCHYASVDASLAGKIAEELSKCL